MEHRIIAKTIIVWVTLIGSFALCWIFGNFWLALGVLLMSISNKAEDFEVKQS